MTDYDCVIVAGAFADFAPVGRLGEDRGARILLLKAGPRPWLQIPIGHVKTFYDVRFNWKSTVEPDL